MARIPTIQAREELAPEHRAVWDQIAQSRGHVIGPFTVLLHSPEIAARAAALGAYIRFHSGLPPRDRELAILAVARELDCRFEWAAHVEEARKVGVDEGTIGAVRDGTAPAGLGPDEAPVVAYTRQLLRQHRADDETFEALRVRLGVQGLVELTATIGYYAMLACTLNAFDVTPD
jgi:4-carboxymuconolactone decarboxylase